MKGMVFNIFTEMIEEKFGFDMLDQLIENTKPQSAGIYTSGETYPDEEIIAYVGELSRLTDIQVSDLVTAFGQYMMQQFSKSHPQFLEGKTAKEFLLDVHDTIHVEVKKLHPDVITPHFTYEEPAPDKLIMYYSSPRKLCHLAEGLIAGVAEVFNTSIRQQQTQCMHSGDEHCRFELEFGVTGGTGS